MTYFDWLSVIWASGVIGEHSHGLTGYSSSL